MSLKSIVLLLALTPCLSCAGGGDITYRWAGSSLFQSQDLLKSEKTLDGQETRELFFLLTAPESCIQLSLKGSEPAGLVTGESREIKLYFIVEREIIMPKQTAYLEIGRNFTRAWEQTTQLRICTDTSVPIQRLEKGTYKIKVTSFTNRPYEVQLAAAADHKVIFSAKKEIEPEKREDK
jgi:hypothetical protein